MLLVNQHIIDSKKDKISSSCFRDLELAKKRGDILEIISLSTLFGIENIMTYIGESIKFLEKTNNYLYYGNKKGTEVSKIKDIAKNFKKGDNVITIPPGLSGDDFKKKLILELNEQKTNGFGYLREIVPFLVGIFVDIITIPSGIETIAGCTLSINNIKNKKEINKLAKNIDELQIVENNMAEYTKSLQDLVGADDINNNYYDINTYFDVLFKIMEDTLSLKDIKYIKEMFKLDYELISTKLKKSHYESFFKDMDLTYVCDTDFIENIRIVLKDGRFIQDMIRKSGDDGNIAHKILDIVANDGFLDLLDQGLSDYDPLPELDWNLLIKSIGEEEYPKFMFFFDNYLIFRLAFFASKQIGTLLNSIDGILCVKGGNK